MINKKCKILFQNRQMLEGQSLGYIGITGGEVCFNTGMTGYQEILTDPSYCGQMITMTYPHIGNYGINLEDVESNKIQCAGFIVKQASEFPSNYRSTSSIDEYLQTNKIIGIQNVDTRMITRMIRDEGAMNGVISSNDTSHEDLEVKLTQLPDMNGLDLTKVVTCEAPYLYKDTTNVKHKIAALDFGINPKLFSTKDIHVHVPEGATPKDGPSAGVAMCTSIVSVLTGIPVKRTVAMTGEITLRGRVLPIGGLKEKLIAALRSNIKTIIIPKENNKDLTEIPKKILSDLKIILVSNLDEVLKNALTKKITPIDWSQMPITRNKLLVYF